jgi:hypothetical protein
VESNPAGDGLGGAVARPKRRSANPRRHVTRPVRCAPVPRVVPVLIRPAGTPLRPAGTGRASTRRSRCAASAPRAAPGSARPLAFAALTSRPAVRAPSSRSGGPRGPPLRETVGSPRGSGRLSSPRLTNGGNARLGGLPARTPRGSTLRQGAALRAERRPLRRALLSPRPGNSAPDGAARRVAPCAYASRRRLRSFVAPTDDASRPARKARLAPGLAPGAEITTPLPPECRSCAEPFFDPGRAAS